MKTKLFFSLVLYFGLFLQSSFAQTYTPFPDSNAVWSDLDFIHFYPSNVLYQTIHYALEGDTIINNISYNKLFTNNTDSTISCTSINTSYHGALRQDTSLKKVYYIPKDSINDILLYDFDISVGDTVNVQTYVGVTQSYQCYSTGYFLFSDGVVRKCYQMFYINGLTWDSWIEGMGSIRGLLNHYYFFKWYNETLCFYQNNTLVYRMDSLKYWDYPYNDSSVVFSGCYQNNVITLNPIENYSKIVISAFPNPFTNTTLISIQENLQLKNITIDIFDVQGRRLKSLHDLKNYQFILSKEDFRAAGVYFVRIKSEKYLETIKLLVQ